MRLRRCCSAHSQPCIRVSRRGVPDLRGGTLRKRKLSWEAGVQGGSEVGEVGGPEGGAARAIT